MIEQVAAVYLLRHIYLGLRVEFAFSIICFIFRTSAMNRCCFAVCILLLLTRNLEAQPNGKIQKSLVRITATEVEPDYRAPWNSGAIQRGVCAGFVIDGSRIMTNAHVVSNNRYLSVEREGDPNKHQAKVLFIAHDCDLAVLSVSAPNF